MARPRTANRVSKDSPDVKSSLRSHASHYFGGTVLGGLTTATPIFEPDKTQFDTKLKMRKDPMIALGLWTIKAPICASEFNIKCDDPVIAAFVDAQIRPIWCRLLRTAMKMLDFGWQPHEIVFEISDSQVRVKDSGDEIGTRKKPTTVLLENMVTIKTLKDINPNTVVPLYDVSKDEFVGVRQTQSGNLPHVDIDKDNLFIPVFDEEWGNKEGKALLDNSYRAWYYGFLIEQLWARFMERRTIPPLLGTGPIGKRVDSEGNEFSTEDLMLTILSNIHHGNGGYLPFEPDAVTRKNQWSVEALQFFSQSDQFQTFMATMDGRMLRGLLIPEKALIQGTKVGTLSETEQFTDTFLTGLDTLLFDLESVINEQIVSRILALNFINAPLCRLDISQITAQRRSSLGDLVTLLLDASDVNSKGVQYRFKDLLDFPALAKQLGIPVKDPDDVLLREEEPMQEQGGGQGNEPGRGDGKPSSQRSNRQPAKANA